MCNAHLALWRNERAGLVMIILYHSHSRYADTGFAHYIKSDTQVLFTAVEQDEVGYDREGSRFIGKMRKSPRERLAHGAVVIGAAGRSDRKAPVITLLKTSVIGHYHTCGYMLVTEV